MTSADHCTIEDLNCKTLQDYEILGFISGIA